MMEKQKPEPMQEAKSWARAGTVGKRVGKKIGNPYLIGLKSCLLLSQLQIEDKPNLAAV